jgi:Flp pilus assembly pilin Flp
MKRGKAQSILEYAMIVAVVAAALAAMSTYLKRSIQANLKSLEDQVNQRQI